jgi:uncharacterized SAM-binding protein YcdF (DUF218 family)
MDSVSVHSLFSWPLLPLGATLLLLGAALRWRNRVLIAAPLVLLGALSTPAVSSLLIGSLERRYPYVPISGTPTADAIYVLGGSLNNPASPTEPGYMNDAGGRFERGLQLYLAGRAPTLLLSAAWQPDPRRPSEGEVLRDLAIARGVPPAAILVTRRGPNTAAESEFLGEIAAAHHWRRVLLVTSAYHMPRAMRLFRPLPLEIVPLPVGFDAPPRSFRPDRLLPQALALARSERALHEYWGMLFYSVARRR